MRLINTFGDMGYTRLYSGDVISKCDERINACGTLDELNSSLGLALLSVTHTLIKKTIERVQQELFIVGAEVGSLSLDSPHKNIPHITRKHITALEAVEKKITSLLPKQKGFIIPKGTLPACSLHVARTICRRAERHVVACKHHPVNLEIIRYLNRLSDVLYLFARLENKGHEEPVHYT